MKKLCSEELKLLRVLIDSHSSNNSRKSNKKTDEITEEPSKISPPSSSCATEASVKKSKKREHDVTTEQVSCGNTRWSDSASASENHPEDSYEEKKSSTVEASHQQSSEGPAGDEEAKDEDISASEFTITNSLVSACTMSKSENYRLQHANNNEVRSRKGNPTNKKTSTEQNKFFGFDQKVSRMPVVEEHNSSLEHLHGPNNCNVYNESNNTEGEVGQNKSYVLETTFGDLTKTLSRNRRGMNKSRDCTEISEITMASENFDSSFDKKRRSSLFPCGCFDMTRKLSRRKDKKIKVLSSEPINQCREEHKSLESLIKLDDLGINIKRDSSLCGKIITNNIEADNVFSQRAINGIESCRGIAEKEVSKADVELKKINQILTEYKNRPLSELNQDLIEILTNTINSQGLMHKSLKQQCQEMDYYLNSLKKQMTSFKTSNGYNKLLTKTDDINRTGKLLVTKHGDSSDVFNFNINSTSIHDVMTGTTIHATGKLITQQRNGNCADVLLDDDDGNDNDIGVLFDIEDDFVIIDIRNLFEDPDPNESDPRGDSPNIGEMAAPEDTVVVVPSMSGSGSTEVNNHNITKEESSESSSCYEGFISRDYLCRIHTKSRSRSSSDTLTLTSEESQVISSRNNNGCARSKDAWDISSLSSTFSSSSETDDMEFGHIEKNNKTWKALASTSSDDSSSSSHSRDLSFSAPSLIHMYNTRTSRKHRNTQLYNKKSKSEIYIKNPDYKENDESPTSDYVFSLCGNQSNNNANNDRDSDEDEPKPMSTRERILQKKMRENDEKHQKMMIATKAKNEKMRERMLLEKLQNEDVGSLLQGNDKKTIVIKKPSGIGILPKAKQQKQKTPPDHSNAFKVDDDSCLRDSSPSCSPPDSKKDLRLSPAKHAIYDKPPCSYTYSENHRRPILQSSLKSSASAVSNMVTKRSLLTLPPKHAPPKPNNDSPYISVISMAREIQTKVNRLSSVVDELHQRFEKMEQITLHQGSLNQPLTSAMVTNSMMHNSSSLQNPMMQNTMLSNLQMHNAAQLQTTPNLMQNSLLQNSLVQNQLTPQNSQLNNYSMLPASAYYSGTDLYQR